MNITNTGLDRMCNRLHLWVPRLHTLNVAGCPAITEDTLLAIVARRPPRGSVVLGRDGTPLYGPDYRSGRGGSSGGAGSGPEVDMATPTGTGGAGTPTSSTTGSGRRLGSVPLASTPKLTSESQWFQLSTSKLAPPAVSYDGTRSLTKPRHAAIERPQGWEPVTAPKPRAGVLAVGGAGTTIGRWGHASDGIKGAHHKHWVKDSGLTWFQWAELGEPPKGSPLSDDALDDVHATTKVELSDEAVMLCELGIEPPTPALQSCVDATTPFVGITWDSHEVEKLKCTRYVPCTFGPVVVLLPPANLLSTVSTLDIFVGVDMCTSVR